MRAKYRAAFVWTFVWSSPFRMRNVRCEPMHLQHLWLQCTAFEHDIDYLTCLRILFMPWMFCLHMRRWWGWVMWSMSNDTNGIPAAWYTKQTYYSGQGNHLLQRSLVGVKITRINYCTRWPIPSATLRWTKNSMHTHFVVLTCNSRNPMSRLSISPSSSTRRSLLSTPQAVSTSLHCCNEQRSTEEYAIENWTDEA